MGKTLDKEIFTLLKEQAIEVFNFLLVTREFAMGKGLQNDVDRINASILESRHMVSISSGQLAELNRCEATQSMGFFDSIKSL